MKHLLLTIALLCLTLPPVGAAESYQQIPPPKPLMCISNTQCDTNPERLEQFVSQFYIWYVQAKKNLYSSIPRNLSHSQQYAIFQQKNKNIYAIYKDLLTDNFYTWYTTFDQTDLGIFPARFCSEDDLDPFLCTLDFPEQWPSRPIVKVIASDWRSIKLAVTLPEWIDEAKNIQKSQMIYVYLKPYKNTLRIDRATNITDSDK